MRRFVVPWCCLALVLLGVPVSAGGSSQAGRYVSLSPARVLDTRVGTGGVLGPVQNASPIAVQVTGVGGVPESGVTAVAINVTVTEPTQAGYLTVWPNGEAMPLASNLNFVANQTVPNMVVVKVGVGGKIAVFSSASAAHVVIDVTGYFGNPGSSTQRSLSPNRVLDTRYGVQGIWGPVTPNSPISVQLAGLGGVPADNATAVVLNVTVTGPTEAGYVTVWPAGESMPLASNLNFVPGQSVPNLVIAKLGAGGRVNVFVSAGAAHVVFDVAGYFTDSAGDAVVPLTPARLADSRRNLGVYGYLYDFWTEKIEVAGEAGVPGGGVSAALLNVTITEPTEAGHLTVWPTGEPMPTASNLNFVAGQTVPNLVLAKLGPDGAVNVAVSHGKTHIVIDVFGYFAPVSGTVLSPGTYVVGSELAPGTYRTRVSAQYCSWERVKGFSGSYTDTIASWYGDGPTIVTVAPGDAGLIIEANCAPFTTDLSPITSSPTAPFGGGVYQVGVDIAAGTWRASGGSGSCYWKRLSGFGGTYNEILGSDYTSSPNPIVTIQPSDKGFDADVDCGTWTKIA